MWQRRFYEQIDSVKEMLLPVSLRKENPPMQPRDYEDGKRRLNSPRRDQRAFRLLPQTAGVPHPARPCPFQSPKRALVAAALRLPSGLVSRRSAADSTPDALFHPPLHSPRRKSRPKHRFSAHSGRRSPFGQLFDGKFAKGARPLAIHAL
jgi:hypothetical protein